MWILVLALIWSIFPMVLQIYDSFIKVCTLSIYISQYLWFQFSNEITRMFQIWLKMTCSSEHHNLSKRRFGGKHLLEWFLFFYIWIRIETLVCYAYRIQNLWPVWRQPQTSPDTTPHFSTLWQPHAGKKMVETHYPAKKDVQAQPDVILIHPWKIDCAFVLIQLLSNLTSQKDYYPPRSESSCSNTLHVCESLKQEGIFLCPRLMCVQPPVDKWFASFHSVFVPLHLVLPLCDIVSSNCFCIFKWWLFFCLWW